MNTVSVGENRVVGHSSVLLLRMINGMIQTPIPSGYLLRRRLVDSEKTAHIMRARNSQLHTLQRKSHSIFRNHFPLLQKHI